MSFIPRTGEASASSSSVLASATKSGRRIAAFATRYQRLEASDTDGPRRIDSALMRGPSSASIEGTTRIAKTADSRPTAAPAAPTEYRKRWGMSTSAASASATVKPENSTVRPAVCTVMRCATSVAPPALSSSSR